MDEMLQDLKEMPTLCDVDGAELKIDINGRRWWVEADGQSYFIEKLVDGKWELR